MIDALVQYVLEEIAMDGEEGEQARRRIPSRLPCLPRHVTQRRAACYDLITRDHLLRSQQHLSFDSRFLLSPKKKRNNNMRKRKHDDAASLECSLICLRRTIH